MHLQRSHKAAHACHVAKQTAWRAHPLTTHKLLLCYVRCIHLQIDRAPQLIRPSRCLFNSSQLRDAVKEPQVTSWIPACQAAQDSCRGTTSSRQPWLKCEYKSLSTFWEVQRHIRNHGAVISRWAGLSKMMAQEPRALSAVTSGNLMDGGLAGTRRCHYSSSWLVVSAWCIVLVVLSAALKHYWSAVCSRFGIGYLHGISAELLGAM